MFPKKHHNQRPSLPVPCHCNPGEKQVSWWLIQHPREEAIARKTGSPGTPWGCGHPALTNVGPDREIYWNRVQKVTSQQTRRQGTLKSMFLEKQIVLLVCQYHNSWDCSVTTVCVSLNTGLDTNPMQALAGVRRGQTHPMPAWSTQENTGWRGGSRHQWSCRQTCRQRPPSCETESSYCTISELLGDKSGRKW